MNAAAINWQVTREDQVLITRIMRRARAINPEIDGMALDMDITATHLNGCPLRLEALLAADDFNFAHDVGGIMRHIDRETGTLRNCFLPRYSARKS